MTTGFLRFGYPDFGQATRTHPEGNPNDSDSFRRHFLTEKPLQPVPQTNDLVPRFVLPRPAFCFTRFTSLVAPSATFSKKRHFGDIFLFCRSLIEKLFTQDYREE